MKVRLHADGTLDIAGTPIMLEPTHRLLDALALEGSLKGATQRLGISYRSAWGQLAALEEALGRRVALKTKGHGSALTPFGVALKAAFDGARRQIEPVLARAETALAEDLRRLLAPEPPRLRLAASHDPLLGELLEADPAIELTVAGSLEALARLAAGTADAAGFHYGSEGPAPPPFDALWREGAVTIVPLFRREQGLMTAPGNPLGLSSVADIAAKQARFVNRQRGAGTRIWFDRLCAEAGVDPAGIAGYRTEEFTHQAVAAVVAGGAADIGMGTRAVAARFGLDYRPLGWEVYFLAISAGTDPDRLAALREAALRKASAMPGYTPPADHHRSACG